MKVYGSVILSVAAVAALGACSGAGTETKQTFLCGAQQVEASFGDERMTLTVGDETYQLNQVQSASGAHYRSDDDVQTAISFWNRADRATLEIGNHTLPECTVPGALTDPYVARGNEPFWRIDVDGDEIRLRRPDEDDVRFEVMEQPVASDGVSELRSAGGELVVRVEEALCADTMADMYFPHQVRVEYDGDVLQGCGGDTNRLLQGVDWQVVEIAGDAVGDYDVTVRFSGDDTINGRAACNSYFGTYQLSGEGIRVSQLAGTKMACEDERMRLEYAFLGALSTTQRFEIERQSDSGRDVILLHTEDGALRLQQTR